MVGVGAGGVRLAFIVAMVCIRLSAQGALSLEQAGARNPSAEFRPAHLNQRIQVRGVVNARVFHFPDYKLLSLDDGTHGAIL